jgi:hypothetical protein
LEIAVKLRSDYEYYRYLAENVNLIRKYTNPKRCIRGREIDLLCWMAVGSDRSKTLKGKPFRDWLMSEGGFTANDVYRYTSLLLKKRWLADCLLKVLPSGQVVEAKEGDIGAMEGYKFGTPIFDKKKSQLSLEMILNINVVEQNNQGEGQVGSRNGSTDSVSDSTSRALHSAV